MPDTDYDANSPFQDYGQVSKSKRGHPDRLKINIWTKCQQSIKDIRNKFSIDKSLIMRLRGEKTTKRIEIWCSNRAATKNLYQRLRTEATRKEGHISLGQSYQERLKKRREMLPQSNFNNTNKHKYDKLLLMHWNARSLKHKTAELEKEMHDKKIKVVCIQESSLPKNEKYHPKFKQYNLYNVSRPNSKGGGLVTLVHESLHVESCETNVMKNIEYMKINIRVNKDLHFTLVNAYIPTQGIEEKELDLLLDNNHNLFIVGDFNSKHNSWNNGQENINGTHMFKWIQTQNIMLINQNKEATYQSPSTGTLSTLDLTLTSPAMERLITNWYVGDDLGSDHFPVYVELSISKQLVQNPSIVHNRYNISKADWIAFMEKTRNVKIEKYTPEQMELKLLEIADQTIPRKKPTKTRRHLNSWWTDEIKKLRKDRQKARKRWKAERSRECRQAYNRCNALLRKKIITEKKKSWVEFVSSINANTPASTVWKKFKSVEGSTGQKIGQIQNNAGEWMEDDKAKAEAFNSFYKDRAANAVPSSKTLTKEEEQLVNQIEELYLLKDSASSPFTIAELKDEIAKLRDSAPGQDGIHNKMIKHCSEEMLINILTVFNDIWNTGNLPEQWKTTLIVPILKPTKDKSQMKSYRPIALTSCLGKLLEKMVNNRLMWKLEKENLLDQLQYGYRKKRSASDAIMFLTSSIYARFEKLESTTAVLIDFEAAFDRIPRTTILLKCIKIGIKGNMLRYIANFLQNRGIKTFINGQESNCITIENGTPQGAVISPTLFNIAVHDIAHSLPPEVKHISYADDVTLFTSHKDPAVANRVMQTALNQISTWCVKWSLKISADKSECAFFTRRNTLADYTPNLALNNISLKHNQCPKLLGVLLDKKLRWKNQIEKTVSECSKRLNAIKAVAGRRWGADTTTLRTFYLSFIRTKLTYCSEVWGAAAKTHINKLQLIQSAALRVCLGCPKTTPISAMEIELAIEPIDLLLEKQAWYKYLKILSLPENHPLCSLKETIIPQSFTRKIALLTNTMPSETPEEIPVCSHIPPWNKTDLNVELNLPLGLTKADSHEALRQGSLELISNRYKDTVNLYTDGSLDLTTNKSGAGYYNYHTKQEFYVPANAASSMDAELLAINAALVNCVQLKQKKFCILTDSKSALYAIQRQDPEDYWFRIKEIVALLDTLKRNGKSVQFQWIPSHCGIHGNEAADKIAKHAANMGPVLYPQYSLKKCKSVADVFIREKWTHRWAVGTTGRTLYEIQKEPTSQERYKDISRSIATFAARARIGHIVTQAYLFRFNLSVTSTCLCCGKVEETLKHILLECSTPSPSRQALLEALGYTRCVSKILKNNCYWSLAAATYYGHRAIGV